MRALRPAVLLVTFATFMLEFPIGSGSGSLIREAHAIIGVPASPGSVAGARRRTRRRTAVVAGSAGYAAGQASAQPVAPAPAPAPARGSAVPALPAGCGALENGVYNCGGTIYKPFFQGRDVVYVVQ